MSERAGDGRRVSRRIAGASRVVQRAPESSCSPIGIRERALRRSCRCRRHYCRVCRVALSSLSLQEPVFPLVTGVYSLSSVLETYLRARVVERSFGEVVDVEN